MDLSSRSARSRRSFLKLGVGVMATATLLKAMSPRTLAAADSAVKGLSISSYASDPKDVDSVNSHWIDTPDGVIVVDVKWTRKTGQPK